MPLILRLVLVALVAYAGYQRAGWFERRYGRTPWGLPAVVWGLFTGFSLLLGCVLLAIAERQGRKAVGGRPVGPAGTPPGGMPTGSPPSGAAPQFGSPQFGGAPQLGSPQFGSPQFGSPQFAPAPQFGAPPPAPQFGAPPPAGQFGTAEEPDRRRPPINEWQDDPSGGFFGRAG